MDTTTLRVSSKRQAKIKMALQGCAGSGKTYSALLLAYGLTKDWSKVAVIDSENGSADLYANLGSYNVLPITDYSPETYIEAINICENAGMEVIIIDSISHCWDYLLEYHAGLPGIPRRTYGELLCELGQGDPKADSLHTEDSQEQMPHNMHNEDKAGLCSQ